MKKHLKGEHGQVSREVESKVKRKKEGKSREQADSAAKKQRLGIVTWKRKDDVPKSQPSIKKAFANLQKYEADGAIQKAYDDALVDGAIQKAYDDALVQNPQVDSSCCTVQPIAYRGEHPIGTGKSCREQAGNCT